MSRVHVIDREGKHTDIEAQDDAPLMYALRDANLPVEGTCGGYASCGSCHVYVASEWLARLPAREDLETDMLSLLDGLDEARSRLSCQIVMRDDLDGLVVELAPET
jgi:2Fe-2S ferredoxin